MQLGQAAALRQLPGERMLTPTRPHHEDFHEGTLVRPPEGLKHPRAAYNTRMSTPEPGLDLHEWESEFASIEPDIADDPDNALVELTSLVGRMLTVRGIPVDDPVADDGEEPEILTSFRAAREVARLLDSAQDVEPDAVATAIEDLRAIYDYLLVERAPP
jgi:hypothetical protein